MIHFAPEPPSRPSDGGYAETVARLASLRNALRLVDPAADAPRPDQVAAAWENASEASRRCFAARSDRTVRAAAAGLEAVLSQRHAGREPNGRSVKRLVEEIRGGIEELQRLLGR